MKALTVCQPYAHLIAIGEKRVENRTWSTRYRGPILIHAGKSRNYMGPDDESLYPDMAFGAFVAVSSLVACMPYRNIISFARRNPQYQWLSDHEHAEGPVCWVLGEIFRLLTPAAIRCA